VFDGSGNLYAASGNMITKFTSGGTSSVFASTNLLGPMGLAFDSNGDLYVSNFSFGNIERYSSNGTDLGTFASGLVNPDGLRFDSNGNLYVVNSANNGTITKITPVGIASIFASTGLSNPTDLAFNSNGDLFVSNTSNVGNIGYIEEYSPDGTDRGTFANTGIASYPRGLAFDSNDNLYEANDSGTINRYSSQGVGSVFVAAGLTQPRFLAFTPSDPENNNTPEPGNILFLFAGSFAVAITLKRRCSPRKRRNAPIDKRC